MPEYQADHERRIATIEGQMQSELRRPRRSDERSHQSAIEAQTDELGHGNEIRQLREKDSRLKGIGDTLKVVAPFIVSIIAVLVAVLKWYALAVNTSKQHHYNISPQGAMALVYIKNRGRGVWKSL